jgi:excinuclease ABC subunit B
MKEATINDEIDKMRMSATRSCLSGATVSSLPVLAASMNWLSEAYYGMLLFLDKGQR